jgi:hypothetical protein
MKKNETYPAYFRRKDGQLVAITAPNRMYTIRKEGSNTNPGITLDHFVTRNQVRRYYGIGDEITRGQFIDAYEALYNNYLDQILQPIKNILTSEKIGTE